MIIRNIFILRAKNELVYQKIRNTIFMIDHPSKFMLCSVMLYRVMSINDIADLLSQSKIKLGPFHLILESSSKVIHIILVQ